MSLQIPETSDGQLYVLITGANSGLGVSTAARLIDENFKSAIICPKNKLTLILCTRSLSKSHYTISRLKTHIRSLVKSSYASREQTSSNVHGQEFKPHPIFESIRFLGVEVDLCDLKNVYALAYKLVNGTAGDYSASSTNINLSPGETIKKEGNASQKSVSCEGEPASWGGIPSSFQLPRIDAILLTAAIGGWKGIAMLPALKEFFVDIIEAVTWPTYKIANVGMVVKPQSSFTCGIGSNSSEKLEEPPLGQVFCANVFGHYILAHELMPLLSRKALPSSCYGGKIIWVSSLEAFSESLSIDDLQGLKSLTPYEGSKRLIDLLVLTSYLPSVKKLSEPFFDVSRTVSGRRFTSEEADSSNTILVKPRNYLVHPGIFVSEIMPLNFIIVAICKLVFYIARWIGSPWHTIDPYKAAMASVCLVLTESEKLEEIEEHGKAKVKWGSATNSSGIEKFVKTEVPGWGWDGHIDSVIDENKLRGRKRDAVPLRSEAKEDFELSGGQCWKLMEDLRHEWETVLGYESLKSSN